MLGMNRLTGKQILGDQHIIASIRDILSTPIGSRSMLRDYGSRLPELIDRPMNDLFAVELYAAVAEALTKWEPRLKLTDAKITGRNNTGRVVFALEGVVISDGTTIRIEGISF